MSAPAPTLPGTSAGRPSLFERVRNFWQRVSEGRAVEDLWSQLAADARASYGFYGKDVDWDEARKLPRWKQVWSVASQFFWALVNKLTPARRVLLLVAFALLLFSNQKSHYEFFAVLLLLFLLALELADKVTMKRDLEIAREIQSWLVPSEPPAIPGAEVAFWTRPQNSVAGDYYDAFFPLADAASGGKLLLVMADVAGKSVPAALLMATLQASLHTLASEGLPLAQLCERLNRYACAHSLAGLRFTTAVVGDYEPSTRRLTYVNAGHNSPIVRRANGGIERLESASLPFGIAPETTFVDASLDLQIGDTLVLFTDGVVEAFNAAGDEFTDARLVRLVRDLPNLPAQATMQYLMQQVGQFVGATRQSDDITCLVLRCI